MSFFLAVVAIKQVAEIGVGIHIFRVEFHGFSDFALWLLRVFRDCIE